MTIINMRKSLILVNLAIFLLLGIIFSCRKKQEITNLDDFVSEYNFWAKSSNYQMSSDGIKRFKSLKNGPNKLRKMLSPDCQINLVFDGQMSNLTVNDFIKGIEKAAFAALTQQVIINYPKIEKRDGHAFVSMTKGFFDQNGFQVAECELVVDTSSGSFLITNIKRTYRKATADEVQKINSLIKQRPYDAKLGLGARYLGGGNFDCTASFSPDGRKIVFSSLKHKSAEIYIKNVYGSNEIRLTNTPFWGVGPFFTPDGNSIQFVSDQDFYGGEPYLMDFDGGNIRKLFQIEDNCFPKLTPLF